MNKYTKFFLLLFLGLSLSSFSQYIGNETNLIKSLRVKSMLVMTDSLKNGCPIDYFEYDENGNEILFSLGITDMRIRKEFDKQNRVVKEIVYFEDENRIYEVDTTVYFYSSRNEFLFGLSRNSLDSTKMDSIKVNPNKTSPGRVMGGVYNKMGQLLSHSYGSIVRPCLGELKGRHTVAYLYLENGLISEVHFKGRTKGESVNWFFTYEFR